MREKTREFLKDTTPRELLMLQEPLLAGFQKLVIQAGAETTPASVFMVMLMASTVVFIFMYAFRGSFLLAAAVAIVTATGVLLSLRYRKRQREAKFDEQLPDVLTMMARSLRAGHSLTGAVELIGDELADPAGGLFRTVYEQQKLGMRVTEGMASLVDKIESLDLRFLLTIVKIHNESGGNLSEILEKLADTVRARLQIRRQVTVFTAQGLLAGYILAILPIATFICLNIHDAQLHGSLFQGTPEPIHPCFRRDDGSDRFLYYQKNHRYSDLNYTGGP